MDIALVHELILNFKKLEDLFFSKIRPNRENGLDTKNTLKFYKFEGVSIS